MISYKFIILKIQSFLYTIFVSLFAICLLFFSTDNISAARNGLDLWVHSVIPTLFPFFVAAELLSNSDIVYLIGRFFKNIMRPFFNVPGEGALALISGIISGYPVGAKIVCNLKENKLCTDVECERLLGFTNNSGPLFILGTVGVGIFKSSKIGLILLVSHILSCLIVGFLFRWWKVKNIRSYSSCSSHNTSTMNIGEVLSCAIHSSINSILMIGGFIVIFSVICSILKSSNILNILSNITAPFFNIIGIPSYYLPSFFTGIIEVTNGINAIPNLENSYTSILICSFLIGFGGMSILLQVFSIINKYNLSIKPYMIGKLLQGVFSVIITYIALLSFHIIV